jgi:hypothetical protein
VKRFEYGSSYTYDPSFSYTINSDYFLREEKKGKMPQWLLYVGDLKGSARHCRCCNFILKTLNASPWMVHDDEDFIILKSQLVGSKLSGTFATPRERDDYDRQFPANPCSQYHRYHRPMLKLYRKRKEEKDESSSHFFW